MQILSQDQRAALLKALELASDEILLTAVQELKHSRISIQKNFEDLKSFVGVKTAIEAPTIAKVVCSPALTMTPPSADTQLTLPAVEAPKENQEPPGQAAYKVGSKTKEEIVAFCFVPRNLDAINKNLGRGKGRMPETESLLKRLWEQKVVKFNEGNYYAV